MTKERETFHCDVGITQITKGKKFAKLTLEVSNELADKLMRAIAGVGKPIYGPILQWQEDKE